MTKSLYISKIASHSILAMALVAGALCSTPLQAAPSISEASVTSMLSLASVVSDASEGSGAVIGFPILVSAVGVGMSVVAIEQIAGATVYVLARASDGAKVSVKVVGHAMELSVGTLVSVGVLSSGIILSVAGNMLAFIPNVIGDALMYNQRLTR